jgi:NADH-quinone oxidoreductase subunit J
MLNSISFYLIAALTLLGAVAALTLRNLVHCALSVAGAFAGIALLFLQLDAEFAGFAQILVYIGAVAILVLFAVLLTRGSEIRSDVRIGSRSWFTGLCAAALVFAGIVTPVLMSPSLNRLPPPLPSASAVTGTATATATKTPTKSATPEKASDTKRLGEAFVNHYAIHLETIGLLLTAALIGAVVIAMKDPQPTTSSQSAAASESPEVSR